MESPCTTEKSRLFLSLATSPEGRYLIRSTRLDDSAARRAASLLISRKCTFFQSAAPRQYWSKRSSNKSVRGLNEISLKGPVPMAALPLLKSATLAAPMEAGTIMMRARSFCKTGFAIPGITPTVKKITHGIAFVDIAGFDAQAATRPRRLGNALQRKLDILRRQHTAIVKFHTGAQFEFPGVLVDYFPTGRQAGLDLQFIILKHQGFVDVFYRGDLRA